MRDRRCLARFDDQLERSGSICRAARQNKCLSLINTRSSQRRQDRWQQTDLFSKKLPFDPDAFVPVTVLARGAFILDARRGLPISSLEELSQRP